MTIRLLPIGDVQVNKKTKFHLFFPLDGQEEEFGIDITAMVVNEKWSDKLVIGVDTMLQEKVDISFPKRHILFHDRTTAFSLPDTEVAHRNFESAPASQADGAETKVVGFEVEAETWIDSAITKVESR